MAGVDSLATAQACGVGFADLSGFTALTQALTPAEVYERWPDWPALVQEPLQLKGFESPVIA